MKEFIEQLIEHLKTQKGACRHRTCEDVTDLIRKFADGYKPRTNADKLRAMTDEELADAITSACPILGECRYPEGSCYDCVYEWLQSEAKE